MIFEGGKMHQIPIQFKGWYLITDGFLSHPAPLSGWSVFTSLPIRYLNL